MGPHRYQRVDNQNDEDEPPAMNPQRSGPVPSSPPPSFHSRSPSPSSRHVFSQDPMHNDADRTLSDTFGGDGDDDSDGEDGSDDRQRLMRGSPTTTGSPETGHSTQGTGMQPQTQPTRPNGPNRGLNRTVTTLPAFTSSNSNSNGGGSRVVHDSHDGVFANLAAKPERGEKLDDLPPTYEQAAADASPPYWETTIVAPGMSSDEVYVDGLPVGSFFSFVWNCMISASFQFVGFFLTYLLHTTHAAKNGSRAGLGLTLVQYGFYMKGGSDSKHPSNSGSGGEGYTPPPDPNSHDFNPNNVSGDSYQNSDTPAGSLFSELTTSEWISYILMIVGWFFLIRAISDYLRARKHEQLVLSSPERGLPVPIIAEGERSETTV